MLTIVEEREGIPLAVVRGGTPAKDDTIWIAKVPYRVVSKEQDRLIVRFAGWKREAMPSNRGKRLYSVNPGPADMAGYRKYKMTPNDINLPKYTVGPSFMPGYHAPAFPQNYVPTPPPPRPMAPHIGAFPTFEAPSFAAPKVWIAYHFQYKVPIFQVESYRTPQVGEQQTFQGITYQNTYVSDSTIMVRPTRPWVGVVIAEDKATGEGIAWVPIVSTSQVSSAKRWLKHILKNEMGLERRSYHLYKKTGNQLRRYYRNSPNMKVPTIRNG